MTTSTRHHSSPGLTPPPNEMQRIMLRSIRAPTIRTGSVPARLLSSTSKPQDTAQQPTQGYKAEPLRFYGNTELAGTPEERMKNVFGGRLEGGERLASSRRDAGEPRIIAGIKVPDKPTEPHNCCMSGCVNCVWEQYNDDIREWRKLRNDAALALNKTEEVWPADFHPPLKVLEFKNVPRELRAMKRKMAKGTKKLSSSAYFPVKGKPGAQNLKKEEEEKVEAAQDDDGWADVPVALRAFAEHERMLKEKKAKKKREMEAKKAAEMKQQELGGAEK